MMNEMTMSRAAFVAGAGAAACALAGCSGTTGGAKAASTADAACVDDNANVTVYAAINLAGGDAAMVQEKCTIDDALYWLVKALDGHRYVIMADDTEDDGDSAHDIYIYNEAFIRTGYLSGGDQIDIDELWSRLTNAS